MKRFAVGVVLSLAALVAAPLVLADGTETLGPPSVPVASGTDVLVAGLGMHAFPGSPNALNFSVPAGATVKQALLYWTGHHSSPAQAGGDDMISVDGAPVAGTLIGGPTGFFSQNQWSHPSGDQTETFSTYRADITSRVTAGPNTLLISDMSFPSNFFSTNGSFTAGNDGVGVMVIYDGGGRAATIGVRDGQDLAFYAFAPPLDTTVPQTFSFPASSVARTATLATMAGSVLGPDAFHGTNRGNLLRVTFSDGSVTDFENRWQSEDGFEFDADTLAVTIPAGATSLTVQALSHATSQGWNPASLDWIAAALSVPDVTGSARVEKRVSGAAPIGTQSFRFELREGASTTSKGTTLETLFANAANGGNIAFTTALEPGATYQLCEVFLPVGWQTTLTNGPHFSPESASDPDGYDNSIICVDFTVASGETKTFQVNNTPPPHGEARTIGYWKNWSSCSGGNQAPILDQTLQATGGIALGSKLTVKTCVPAYNILNKSTIDTAAKRASDPAFNLAAQLLAAKLNVARNAATCAAATSAITAAHNLLGAVGFTGKAAWVNTMTAAQRSQANTLATTLDNYNNNTLC